MNIMYVYDDSNKNDIEHTAFIYDNEFNIINCIVGKETYGYTAASLMEECAYRYAAEQTVDRLADFVAEGNRRDAQGDADYRYSDVAPAPFVNEVIEVIEDNGGATLETRRVVVARTVESVEMLNALRTAKICAGDAYTSASTAETMHLMMFSGAELEAEKALLAVGITLFRQGYRYGSIRQQDGAVIMPARTILAQQESLYHNAGGVVMLHIEYVFKK